MSVLYTCTSLPAMLGSLGCLIGGGPGCGGSGGGGGGVLGLQCLAGEYKG